MKRQSAKLPRFALALGLAASAVGPPVMAQEAPALEIALHPVIRVTGEVGSTYLIESTIDVESDFWLTRGWIELTTPTAIWTDPVPTDSPQKVYRAVKVTKPAVQTIANMVWIPPGSFVMGSPEGERARSGWEGPLTRVTLTQGFWMGKYEVTQREYLTVKGNNPSYFQPPDYAADLDRPVEQVSWDEAVAYCQKVTEQERASGRLSAGYAYRLPTEAEWEYACRAGTMTPFHYGNALRSGMANFRGMFEYPPCGDSVLDCYNPGGIYLARTTWVGSYAPNAWGLSDMHGNVYEWCQDRWRQSLPGGETTDPKGPSTGSDRVIRGGSCYSNAADCRSAYRYGEHTTAGFANIGFRLVLAPGQP